MTNEMKIARAAHHGVRLEALRDVPIDLSRMGNPKLQRDDIVAFTVPLGDGVYLVQVSRFG
jgi:hypothetical protein